MTKSELSAFVQAIEAISVEPPKPAPTETVRPVILNPFFWFACITQALLIAGTQVQGEQFERLWLAAVFANLMAIIASLAYDKVIVHVYRVAVTAAPGKAVSPLRAAQLKVLGSNG